MISSSFNAENWLESVIKIFHSCGETPKGQDPFLVRIMRTIKLSSDQIEPLVQKALTEARNIALSNFNVSEIKQANKTNK